MAAGGVEIGDPNSGAPSAGTGAGRHDRLGRRTPWKARSPRVDCWELRNHGGNPTTGSPTEIEGDELYKQCTQRGPACFPYSDEAPP